VADAEAEFRGWVVERAASRSNDLAVAKEEAVAKERLTAGDYAGVAAALERAHALKPKDPQILFNLASALMRTERLEEAATWFGKVLALPLKPAESRFRLFSHYQIGRVLDILGKREEALAAYRKVLDLPDEFDAHRLATERLESPATREQLE
jgi:tetratricopeptide (TPR) repeat protein